MCVCLDSVMYGEIIRMVLTAVYFLIFWFIFLIFKKWGPSLLTHSSGKWLQKVKDSEVTLNVSLFILCTEHESSAEVHQENIQMISLQHNEEEEQSLAHLWAQIMSKISFFLLVQFSDELMQQFSINSFLAAWTVILQTICIFTFA